KPDENKPDENGNEGTQEPNKPDENKPDENGNEGTQEPNKPDENGNWETQEPNKPDENKPDENGNGKTQEPNKPDENKPDENGNEETQEPNKQDENKPGEDEGTATEPNKPETNESNKPNTNESNESNKPNASNPGTQGSNQGAPVPSESEKEPSGSGLISNPVSNGKAPVTAGTQTVLPEELTNNSFSAISKTPAKTTAKLPQTGERSNSSTIWAGIAIFIASVSSLAFIPRRKKN
ncbi:LPXTG cell wall anchor domain-containing protein, partial [Companilactobacillus versmoldensis]